MPVPRSGLYPGGINALAQFPSHDISKLGAELKVNNMAKAAEKKPRKARPVKKKGEEGPGSALVSGSGSGSVGGGAVFNPSGGSGMMAGGGWPGQVIDMERFAGQGSGLTQGLNMGGLGQGMGSGHGPGLSQGHGSGQSSQSDIVKLEGVTAVQGLGPSDSSVGSAILGEETKIKPPKRKYVRPAKAKADAGVIPGEGSQGSMGENFTSDRSVEDGERGTGGDGGMEVKSENKIGDKDKDGEGNEEGEGDVATAKRKRESSGKGGRGGKARGAGRGPRTMSSPNPAKRLKPGSPSQEVLGSSQDGSALVKEEVDTLVSALLSIYLISNSLPLKNRLLD